MDFAADAMLDVQPPPRAAGKPARADSATDDASFAEHLDAAANDRPAEAPAPRAPKKGPAEPEPSDQAATALVVAPQELPAATSLLTLISSLAEDAQPTTMPSEATPNPPPNTLAPDVAEPRTTAPPKDSTDSKAATQPDSAGVFPTAEAPPETIEPAPAETEAQTKTQFTAQQQTAPLPLALVSLVAQQNTAPTSASTPKTQDPRVAEAPPRGAEPHSDAPDAAPKTPEPTPNAFKAALKTAQSGAEQSRPAPPLAIERVEANTGSPQSALAPTTTLQSSAPTEHIASAHAMARAVPATHQVAQEIIRRFDGDTTQFELRLDPPELGRVEVRLEVSRDHRVTAVVAADNPQALAELARHARDLEQMLQSAGLQLSDKGLSFDLRQSHDRATDARHERAAGENGGQDNAEDGAATSISARPVGFERWRGVRVDISV